MTGPSRDPVKGILIVTGLPGFNAETGTKTLPMIPCGRTKLLGACTVKLVMSSVIVIPEYDDGFVIVKTTRAFREVLVGLKVNDGIVICSCFSAGKNCE